MNFELSLPTLAIILVLFGIYYLADKRSSGLAKLKRFSDRAKEDISVFIKEKSLEIDELSINLDSNLSKGREVLKRILSFEEMLENKAGDFEKMKSTVDAYAGTLQELINMSARVDENLKRLSEESDFVDKVDRKIKTMNSHIARLETELSGTQDKIIQRGSDELSEIKQKLLKSHEQSVAALQNELEKYHHRAADIETFLKRLDSKKGETVRQSEAIIQQAFKQFRGAVGKQKDQDTASLKNDLDAIFEEARQQKQTMTAEFEKAIAGAVSRKESLVDDLENSVSAAEHTVESLEKEFSQQKNTIKEDLQRTMAALEHRNKEVGEQFTEKLDDYKEQFSQIERMYYTHLSNAAKKGEDFEDEVFINLKKKTVEKTAAQEKEMQKYFAQVEAALAKRKKEIVDLFGALRSDTHIWHAEAKKEMKSQEIDLERQLKQLEAHTRGSIEQFTATAQNVHVELDERVSGFISTTQSKIEELEETFNDYSSRLAEKIDTTETETERLFDKMTGKSNDLEQKIMQTINTRITEYEEEVAYKFQKLDEANVDIQELESSLRELMETTSVKMKKEFHVLAETLSAERHAQQSRAEEEMDALRRELDNIEAGVSDLKKQAYETASEKLQLMQDEFFNDLGTRRDALEQHLEKWQEKADNTIVKHNSSNEEKLQKLGDQFEKRFQKELITLRKTVDGEVHGIEEQVRAMSAQFADEIAAKKELLAELKDNLDEIDRRQKNFAAQTKVFERADSLKLSLESDISSMKKDIAKIDTYKREMDDITKEYFSTKKIVEEVNGKMRNFLTEKKRIDMIENNFSKLMDISNALDTKLEAVTTQHDLVQEMELKLRELSSLEQDIEERYARLEGRKKVIEATTTSVDKNFSQLSTLEQTLKSFEKEMKLIPKSLTEMKKDVEKITAGKDITEKVVDKIERLDGLIEDIEVRAEKMNVARDWLARAETRFEKVNKDASEQLRLLESLLKEERVKGKTDRGAPSMDKRQTVTKLARQGWSVEEIARATKLSRGEVELILELISDKVTR
ncbi:MAG: hypothetical protein JW904_05720 [Spirochaetales bacterium]|nr:hypothetical protein [Spirochaetales bacterium]